VTRKLDGQFAASGCTLLDELHKRRQASRDLQRPAFRHVGACKAADAPGLARAQPAGAAVSGSLSRATRRGRFRRATPLLRLVRIDACGWHAGRPRRLSARESRTKQAAIPERYVRWRGSCPNNISVQAARRWKKTVGGRRRHRGTARTRCFGWRRTSVQYPRFSAVMAGFVPAIHALLQRQEIRLGMPSDQSAGITDQCDRRQTVIAEPRVRSETRPDDRLRDRAVILPFLRGPRWIVPLSLA